MKMRVLIGALDALIGTGLLGRKDRRLGVGLRHARSQAGCECLGACTSMWDRTPAVGKKVC